MKLCAASMAVRLSRVPIPSKRLRCLIYRNIYGKKYAALDESELEHSLSSYPSVNALFTRGIKPELRPITQSNNQLLCPCDGQVQDVGQLKDGKLLTIKGIEYTVNSLLATKGTRAFRNGHYAIVFLSPCDCHRIFSPQDGHCHHILHVPGYRLLVHPPFQRKEFPTYTLNERVVLHLSTSLGACALVMVAGWGVGNVTLAFDKSFKMKKRLPRNKQTTASRSYSPPLAVQKGEWLATFQLGSTVILLTDQVKQVKINVSVNETVKYGQPLFSRAE